MSDTQKARLLRAAEKLRTGDDKIHLILIAYGPRDQDADLRDYLSYARSRGLGDGWAGAHAGVYDDTGRLRRDGKPVLFLDFSCPIQRPDIPPRLIDALEGQAFFTTWRNVKGGPGTTGDAVRLHLIEED